MLFNKTLLTKKARNKLEDNGINIYTVEERPWLIAIKLENGQTVAAYPPSIINPAAPPVIYMADPKCDAGIDNRESSSKIAGSLKKWCKDDGLLDAVELLKNAINYLET